MVLARLLLAFSLALLPAVLLAAPGDLDSSFNGTGKVVTGVLAVTGVEPPPATAGAGIYNLESHSQNVAFQGDGKIVVCGSALVGGNYDFAVECYNPNGSLDTSFNGTGRVTTPVGTSAEDFGYAVAVQHDGKILVTGCSRINFNRLVVVRFNQNGSLDTTFNGTGKLIRMTESDREIGVAILVQPDGRILVLGRSEISGNRCYMVLRLNEDGTPDTNFGISGEAKEIPLGGPSSGHMPFDLALQKDGKIVVAGKTSTDTLTGVALLRYTSGGQLDTSFNGSGKLVRLSPERWERPFEVEVQEDGKILVAGVHEPDVGDTKATGLLLRFLSNGDLDTGFGVSGKAQPDHAGRAFDYESSVGLQPNGEMLLTNYFWNGSSYEVKLLRYLPNGMRDDRFNLNAKIPTLIGGQVRENKGGCIAIQKDGKIVVVAETLQNDLRIVLTRFEGGPTDIGIYDGNTTLPADQRVSGESPVDFGAVYVGTTTPYQTLTVRNTGSLELTDLAVELIGANADKFEVVASDWAASLMPGESRMIQVRFIGNAAGVFNGAIHITSSDPDESEFVIPLVGAVINPEIALELAVGGAVPRDGNVDLGNVLVGGSGELELHIRNVGDTNLTGVSASFVSGSSSRFTIVTAPEASVEPGEQTVMRIRFAPTALGSLAANISISSNDADENPFLVGFSGQGISPEIVIKQGTGPELINGSNLSFGTILTNRPYTLSLLIENTGDAPLTNLNVSFTSGGPVTVPVAPPSSIEPGGSHSLTVEMQSALHGHVTGSIQIHSSDLSEGTLIINFSATVQKEQPVITSDLTSQMAVLGTEASIQVVVTGAPPLIYKWFKGTVLMPNAMVGSLVFPLVRTTDVGVYRVNVSNEISAANSKIAYLGVMTPVPEVIPLNRGTTLLLSTGSTVPAGCKVGYAWAFMPLSAGNWGPLSNGVGISGAGTRTLRVTKMDETREGYYSCEMTITPPSGDVFFGSPGVTRVHLAQIPTFGSFELGDAFVGEKVTEQVIAGEEPTRFSATGLPSGVVLHSQTGAITGQPKAARVVAGVVLPYRVKFQISNIAGTRTVEKDWLIKELPGKAFGTFNGLVERNNTLNAGLGGTLKMVIAKTASFSGTLTLGALTYSLSGVMIMPPALPSGLPADPGGVILIPRKSPLTPLTLTWKIWLATGELTCSVDGGILGHADAKAWQSPWSSVTKAATYSTAYTAALSPPEEATDASLYPQGYGYATLVVGATGLVTVGGKLADGTAITNSTTLGLDGQIALHVLLYLKTGSIQGWSQITATGEDDPWDSISTDPSWYSWNTISSEKKYMDGVLNWWKADQGSKSTSRSFKQGIPLHDLVLTGGRYKKALTGEPVFRLYSFAPVFPQSTSIKMSRGPMTNVGLSVDAAVSDKHVVKVAVNNQAVNISSLNTSTGIFSGTLTALDLLPGTSTQVKRPGNLYGVIVQRLGMGMGHVLLPRMPLSGSEVVSKLPILSGETTIGIKDIPSGPPP